MGFLKKWQYFFIGALSLFFLPAIAALDLGIECKIFDVGQGNGVAVKDRSSGRRLIIDAGHTPWNAAGPIEGLAKSFFDFVNSAPFESICIVISHPDADHMNVVTKFLEANSLSLRDVHLSMYFGGPLNEYLFTKKEGAYQKFKLGRELLTRVTELLEIPRNPTKPIKIHFLSHALYSGSILKILLSLNNIDDLSRFIQKTQRPFFMNVQIPEFQDGDRSLSSIILAANASHEASHANLLGIKNLIDVGPTGEKQPLSTDANNNSAVVKVSYKGKSMIFPGDIGGYGTIRMLLSNPAGGPGHAPPADLLKADVLLASHHGAETERANDSLWTLRTDPSYVVVSAGKNLGYLHPRFSSIFTFGSVLKSKAPVAQHSFCCFDKGKAIRSLRDSVRNYFSAVTVDMVDPGSESDSTEVTLKNITLPLYSTYSSGMITIEILSDGSLELTTER